MPGEVAEATTVVWMDEKTVNRLARGPYRAYFLPDQKWIEPPRVPTEAVPIGTIDFTPPQAGARKGLASISFVVPDVPTASYGISYCNDPCTIATVGDLTGGWIRVADDAEEAQLLAEREEAGWKASALEWKLKRAQRQIDRLTGEAEAVGVQAAELRADVLGLTRRLDAAAGRGDAGPDAIPILAAGLGGLALGLFLRRRRRVPDPSPVEEAERILERIS